MSLFGDEARRRRIAAAGHQRVQRLRWGDATDRLLEFYERLAAKPRPQSK
jgi:glycosyltransferase involved in cell wall biosynthesis